MKNLFILILMLIFSSLNAQVVHLKDLSENTNNYETLGIIGHSLYFKNQNIEDYKWQLWVTDGTKKGTKPLEFPGEKIFGSCIANDTLYVLGGSYKKENSHIYMVLGDHIETIAAINELATSGIYSINNKLFIPDYSDNYIIDKTTHEVHKIAGEANNLLIWNGTLYYNTSSALNRFDGSLNTSVKIKQIWAKKIFKISDEKFGFITKNQLWVSDGTKANTLLIKEFTDDFPIQSSRPFLHLNANGVIFFTAKEDGISSIWSSNGTPSGTFSIQNTSFPQPTFFMVNNEPLFLDRRKIWKIDSTTKTAYMVDSLTSDINETLTRTATKNGLLLVTLYNNKSPHYLFYNGQWIAITAPNKNHPTTPTPYANTHEQILATNQYLYLSMLDDDYGAELHQIHLESGETETIIDASTYGKHSVSYPLGVLEEQLLFVSGLRKQPTLYKFQKNASTQALPDLDPNYDWLEVIVPTRENDKAFSKSMAINPDGSCVFPVSTSYGRCLLAQNSIPIKYDFEQHQGSVPLIKIQPDGTHAWHQMLPVSLFDARRPVVASDQLGNTIAAIPIEIDSLILDSVYTKKSKGDYILAKFSPQGKLLWHKYFDLNNEDVNKIITDQEGNIYLSGTFSQFNTTIGNIVLKSSISPSSFVAKFNSSGDVIWAKAFEPKIHWEHLDNCYNMSISSDNRLYFTENSIGYFSQSSCKYQDFYYRINALNSDNGELAWQKEIKGNDFGFSTALAVSPNGEVYVAGRYRNKITADDISFTTNSCEKNASYILKINRQGSVVVATIDSLDESYIHEIKFDQSGNYYISGIQELEQKTPLHGFPSIVKNKIAFIKKYTPKGQLLNEHFLKGGFKNNDHDRYFGRSQFGFTPDGDIIFKTMFRQQMDSLNATYHYPDFSFSKILIIKFNMGPDLFTPSKNQAITFSDIQLSPNPAQNYLQIYSTDLDFKDAQIDIFSIDGKQWTATRLDNSFGVLKLDTSHLPSGTYVARFILGDTVFSKKFIKI